MLEGFAISISLLSGFIIGLLAKGTTIHIIHKEKEKSVDKSYNESMVDHMDPTVRQYYEQNNGLNKY